MLKSLKIEYVTVGVGEYVAKARFPSTRSHRKLFIPLVAALEQRKDVVLLTHDECNMTVNLSQPKAYCETGKPFVDLRKKSGVGQGEVCVLYFSLSQLVVWCRNWNVSVSEFVRQHDSHEDGVTGVRAEGD
jgi:hypothetical protein